MAGTLTTQPAPLDMSTPSDGPASPLRLRVAGLPRDTPDPSRRGGLVAADRTLEADAQHRPRNTLPLPFEELPASPPKRTRVRSWLRCSGAVLAGYITTAVVVFGGLTAGFELLGSERAYARDSLQVSSEWVAVHWVLSLAAATVGGHLCAVLDGRRRAWAALALWTAAVGWVAAVAQRNAAAPFPRLEAAENALAFFQEAGRPLWVGLGATALGVCGTVLGAYLRRRQLTARACAQLTTGKPMMAADESAEAQLRDRGLFGSARNTLIERVAKEFAVNPTATSERVQESAEAEKAPTAGRRAEPDRRRAPLGATPKPSEAAATAR